ncbi:MAG: hypothetical protein FWD76_05535 [Firmicutes bacterium]|nr:hypothetical protein [Bacillota bacterium]
MKIDFADKNFLKKMSLTESCLFFVIWAALLVPWFAPEFVQNGLGLVFAIKVVLFLAVAVLFGMDIVVFYGCDKTARVKVGKLLFVVFKLLVACALLAPTLW